MGRRETGLVAVALAIAGGVAWVSATVLVELLSGNASPTQRQDRQVTAFWIALPLTVVASLLGTWIGTLMASDGRPLPGWRAGKWGAAVGIGLGVVLMPLGVLAILLAPVAMVAASSSGAVTAFFLSKGTHGKA